jgi:CRP/FNR family putative post-exponential-phase nitrogen-starvation transcriptional regulator
MTKEKLKPEHISVLGDYGLEDMDRGDVSVLHFKKNEYILQQGYPSEYVFLVLSGKMKVFITSPNGKTLLFCFYTMRGILGEAEFATDEDIAAMSVQAITEVYCIGISRSRGQEYLKQNNAFLNAVNTALAAKLFRCTRNSAVTILYSLESRLCAYISMTNENGFFNEKLTEVSQMLGTSYRHLMRTLDILCRQGILIKEKRGYHVADSTLLKEKGEDYYLA